MSQSTIIALLLAAGFLFYIAARNRLPLYMAALGIGQGAIGAGASGGTAAGGVAGVIGGAANAISGGAGSISSIANSLKSLPSLRFGGDPTESGGGDYGGGGAALGVPDVLGG